MEFPRWLRGFALIGAFCALTIFGGAALAQTSPALSITIPIVTAPPKVDGTLTDPAWQKAAKVQMPFDRFTHGASAEQTTVYLLTDGKSLYVAYDAKQTRAPIVANQHNNNTGVDTDDEVKLALWPSGKNGINYQFIATPIGTRYQYSTENLSYEPRWDAVGKIGTNGYVLTMRVPLSAMHGANQNTWLINVTRWEVTTGSLYAWSGGASFQGTPDQNYAMPLLGMPATSSVRPQPRVGVYGLTRFASPVSGGSTSRSGADLSIPITNTTSFIAAIHPDFSNVEQDQQTIAPTAFRQFFQETRPFFTQGANYYNFYECDACNAETSLYTPSIPTPRDGYAIEGKQGPITFAGFDAVGFGRTDVAQSAVFRTPNQHYYISGQHVSVNGRNNGDLPGPAFRDDTWQFSTKFDDLQHKFIYANYGTESATGNWITDPSQAKFGEIGGALYGPHSFFGGGLRHIGAQYNPFDGFFTHGFDANFNTTAMNGYGAVFQHIWTPLHGSFRSINFNIFNDSYHGAQGMTQWDLNTQLDLVTRNQWEYVFDTGASYFMIGGKLTPVTQESTRIIYHTATSTPTSLWFVTGRWGAGRLDTWLRSTTFRLGNRGSVSLEADDTRQYLDHPQANGSSTNVQWLERASFAYQIDPNTSLALGVRRFFGPPTVPSSGNTCVIPRFGDPNALGFCPNISLALHRSLPHDEFYFIYGSASHRITVPQIILKWIHYVGAEKGT